MRWDIVSAIGSWLSVGGLVALGFWAGRLSQKVDDLDEKGCKHRQSCTNGD